MPLKHRLMTLRDDLVFFIFLYQRWIYPVDVKRPDEFGYVHHNPPSLENQVKSTASACLMPKVNKVD